MLELASAGMLGSAGFGRGRKSGNLGFLGRITTRGAGSLLVLQEFPELDPPGSPGIPGFGDQRQKALTPLPVPNLPKAPIPRELSPPATPNVPWAEQGWGAGKFEVNTCGRKK